MDFKKIKPHLNLFLFFFLSILYSEIVLKIATCNSFFNLGLVFMPLFSFCAALLFTTICSLFGEKVNQILTCVILSVLFVLFATQAVYHDFFGKYLIIYSLTAGGADQIIADGLLTSTLTAIFEGIPVILLFFVPLLLFIIFRKKKFKFNSIKIKFALPLAAFTLILHLSTLGLIYLSPDVKPFYYGVFDPNLTVKAFGLLQSEGMDFKYNLFGFDQKVYLSEETLLTGGNQSGEGNVQNIDFDALLENESDEDVKLLHKYFSTKSPTNKNDYTGIFKDYNLVFMVAEGFSPYAVDENLTPNLYKLTKEGFNFTNFYTPLWGVSTSDGEFTACTGLIPKSGIWSFYASSENYMPFCLGNQFKSNGIKNTFAYHNNNYAFYHRDVSHTNMGYNYKGVGNGLEDFITDCWPQSDLEMIEGTLDDYLSSDEPFHAYYMTVSGHLDYNKTNAMVRKNWDLVKDLNAPDTVKAYYACNIELDKAVGLLLNKLEEAGVAEKTVIAITPDHYPYGLEDGDNENTKYQYFDYLAGHKIDPQFELYKSNFILYCPTVKEPVTVSKYCSSLDVLPTLLNLFGFEYDSRLLMGKDILSYSEGLVIFADRSFITDKGKYNAQTGEFYANDGVVLSEAEKQKHIDETSAVVNNKTQISALIIDTDYYGNVFKK